jgi:U3 small nucleolar RNA-associated protein 13
MTKEFPPLYTGGKFALSKDFKNAFALNNGKVSIFEFQTGGLSYTLDEDNEEAINFSVSPNEKYIATTNKNFLTRVYQLDLLLESEARKQVVASFKTPNQMCLELCFDPTSRFLALGTSDSHVKVFDVIKGFQTHNFIGHRGVIVQLQFMPGTDTLKLLSAGEDHTVKVWDLVLNKEVAALKGNVGRCTAIQFTNDCKTLFVGARDGKVTMYNCQDRFKQIGQLDLKELGLNEEEVTCLSYIQVNQKSSLLAIGGSNG